MLLKLHYLPRPNLEQFFSQNWTPLQWISSVLISQMDRKLNSAWMTHKLASYLTAKWVKVGNTWSFLRIFSWGHLWRKLARPRSRDIRVLIIPSCSWHPPVYFGEILSLNRTIRLRVIKMAPKLDGQTDREIDCRLRGRRQHPIRRGHVGRCRLLYFNKTFNGHHIFN